ncbi:hypothetical protein FIU87_11980 [Bacillus sp. THAF10]|uniref:cell wall elongation regulator TseB-like domain-containing protein n=1 Tax=Bacillus sp. THAF10 TaxID=2587848 RepID=UPI0012689013|nr:DUF5590 domain-containing protein [Bacillus sp. THAF10]QFT89367.1 hypothetical protein FIU87_11980 [Bacillus sp. THAF10]
MKNWIIISSICIVILLIWQFSSVYFTAMSPIKEAKEKAEKIAMQEANLQSVEEISTYNGTKAYTIIQGTNSDGESVIVWVNDKQKVVHAALEKNGIAKEEVLNYLETDRDPQEIISITLAMEKNTPLWEIKFKDTQNQYNLYYIKYENGEYFQRIIF